MEPDAAQGDFVQKLAVSPTITLKLSQVFLIVLLILSYALLLTPHPIAAVLIWPMLFHGTHEQIHASLFVGQLRSSRLRRVFSQAVGVFGSAHFGQNFFVIKRAHLEHHIVGRSGQPHGLIDHRLEVYGKWERLFYYAEVLGLNYWAYWAAGLIFIISPAAFSKCFFRIKLRQSIPVLLGQIVVISTLLLQITVMGWILFLIAHVLFSVYWGLAQNMAHYGLEIGGSNSRVASRTYALPAVINFLMFGSVFRHLEHHVLPRVPGPLLGCPGVQLEVARRLNGSTYPIGTAKDYVKSMFGQLRDPQPRLTSSWYES